MTGINALLAARGSDVDTGPWMGTVTANNSATPNCTVRLDGATTAVTVRRGSHGAVVNDRVMVIAMGRTLYMVENLNEDGVWHTVGAAGEPAFQNGWTHFDARTVRFRAIAGRVELDGIAKSGTIPATIFFLPPGFRPPNRAYADSFTPTFSNAAIAEVDIGGSNGNVAAANGSNAWFSLCQVWFPRAN